MGCCRMYHVEQHSHGWSGAAASCEGYAHVNAQRAVPRPARADDILTERHFLGTLSSDEAAAGDYRSYAVAGCREQSDLQDR
jgi:hypothetical protein